MGWSISAFLRNAKLLHLFVSKSFRTQNRFPVLLELLPKDQRAAAMPFGPRFLSGAPLDYPAPDPIYRDLGNGRRASFASRAFGPRLPSIFMPYVFE
jgi:hypothetical protein